MVLNKIKNIFNKVFIKIQMCHLNLRLDDFMSFRVL